MSSEPDFAMPFFQPGESFNAHHRSLEPFFVIFHILALFWTGLIYSQSACAQEPPPLPIWQTIDVPKSITIDLPPSAPQTSASSNRIVGAQSGSMQELEALLKPLWNPTSSCPRGFATYTFSPNNREERYQVSLYNSSGSPAFDKLAKILLAQFKERKWNVAANLCWFIVFGNAKGDLVIRLPPDIDFGPYMADLQKRIKNNWHPPKSNQSRRVKVHFEVHSDGVVSNIRIQQSSGVPEVDETLITAVKNASPFSPFPAGSPDDMNLEFTGDYNLIKPEASSQQASQQDSIQDYYPHKRALQAAVDAIDYRKMAVEALAHESELLRYPFEGSKRHILACHYLRWYALTKSGDITPTQASSYVAEFAKVDTVTDKGVTVGFSNWKPVTDETDCFGNGVETKKINGVEYSRYPIYLERQWEISDFFRKQASLILSGYEGYPED